MYILRTADCCDNELLTIWQYSFKRIIDYPELWIVRRLNTSGRSACENWRTGLPQLFLAGTIRFLGFCRGDRETSGLPSAAGTEKLQAIILAQVDERLQTEVPDFTRNRMLERWKAISGSPPPFDEVYGKQKFWDRKITEQSFSMLLANCTSEIDKTRILASKAAHTGDWLNAPSIISIGLRMSNETIRVAVGLRLGAKLCEPHQCTCGALVDARGLHGLSCRRSAGTHGRHSLLNDTIWRALNKAGVHSTKEQTAHLRSDGIPPDG